MSNLMSAYGIQTNRTADPYSMGIRVDPHPYGTCECGAPSEWLIFHAEADHRAGSRRMACEQCLPGATALVTAFYGGRKL